MNVKLGFDLYPPLTQAEPEELTKWSLFLNKVQAVCREDPLLKTDDKKFVFQLGNNPATLLRNGIYFRRFSSVVTDSSQEAHTYVVSIFNLAKVLFEGRVFFWSEYGYEDEPMPKYTSEEIQEAEEAYLRSLSQ